jgi:hypothetical protein
MKKYMLLYIVHMHADAPMPETSPEDMAKGLAMWTAWFEKCGSALVDTGSQLGHGVRLTPTETTETRAPIGGYSIVQADDLDGVKLLLTGHPHYMMPEASIEVLEILPMEM